MAMDESLMLRGPTSKVKPTHMDVHPGTDSYIGPLHVRKHYLKLVSTWQITF
jgi:hypothetical protein